MVKFTKTFLGALLPVLVLLCLSATASAAGPVADADFNNGTMHWNISEDNVLTISGTGVTPDYGSSVNAPWYSYRSQIRSIVVEEGVTGLGDYAFYGLSSTASISLPASLETLGAYCFSGCGSLTAIDLPDGIAALPSGIFYGCSSLKEITIPEGITNLDGYNLFGQCSSLTAITLPSTLQSMKGSEIFWGTRISDIYYNGTLSQWLAISFSYSVPMQSPCNLYIDGEKLTNLTIPGDVTSIPAYAFQYVNLNSVTLSYRVKEIGEYAFYGSSVASARMMDSVTAVGTNAFANCSLLKKVYYVGDQSKWSSIAWNTGNDALIDAERFFVSSLDEDVHTVSVGPVEHGSVTLSDSYCVAGDVITVAVQPDLGWRLRCIKVNGVEIAGSSFIAEANLDYVVTAEFEFYMDVKDHGVCGPNLTWYLFDNNELVINGTGPMNDFYNGSSPWYNYRGIIQSIAIGEGVTSIGAYAFSGCTLVESITLPDSVERIGGYSFQGCSSLANVELPYKLSYMAAWSFMNCNLKSVYYSGDVSSWLRIEFGNPSWNSCFPHSVTEKFYIGGELIENLVIPEGVTRIPGGAFQGYRGLRSISFPGSLQTIGDFAFYGCSGLESIVFPAGAEMIGERAFDCGLTYAEFMGSTPSLGAYPFGDPSYNNNNIVIYYHAGTIGWTSPNWNGYYAACVDAFSDYSALDADNRNAQGILFTLNEAAKTAMVGDGSDNWNNSGYYGAQKGAVVIPDAVTKNGTVYQVIGIGPNAFSRNRHVTSVSIGAGVTSVIPSAFVACPALESITVSAGNEYYSSIDGVLYDVSGLYLYVYPGGKTDTDFTVPSSVRTIGMYAFYDNEYLRTLTVGRNVTAIYRQSFCGLTNLEEITLPFIGTREKNADDSYYYYSESFDSVFGDGYHGKNCLKEHPQSYYYDQLTNDRVYVGGKLQKVTITGGTLYRLSFSGCSSIQEITVAAVPSAIPERCFSNCIALQKITFAGRPCNIGELVLPEGITSIGSLAFANCKAITSATLPASLTSIDSTAFSGAGLEQFTVAAGNRNYSTDSWGVLYNINKTNLVQYPAGRKWPYYNVASTAVSIGRQAFSGCEMLANLYIPNSVTSIDSQAVVNCPYLTLCCYMNSVAYNYALNNGLTAWYMDNKTLQGIRIYSLPEQTAQVQGQVNLQGLYVVGNYGGKELQIDDYTVSYDQRTSGVKTVTVEYQGKTVTFEMVLYVSSAGNIISFRCDEDLDGKTVWIAIYNKSGAMLHTGEAIISNGEAQIGVSSSVYQNADHAKLFILDEETFAPAADAKEQSVH